VVVVVSFFGVVEVLKGKGKGERGKERGKGYGVDEWVTAVMVDDLSDTRRLAC
jgi:hypothetical protein